MRVLPPLSLPNHPVRWPPASLTTRGPLAAAAFDLLSFGPAAQPTAVVGALAAVAADADLLSSVPEHR